VTTAPDELITDGHLVGFLDIEEHLYGTDLGVVNGSVFEVC